MESIKSGYEYSSHLNQDGIEMDVTIKTTREMAMPELFGRYAALSHGVYLEMAKDVSTDSARGEKIFSDQSGNVWNENTVMGINRKVFEGAVGVMHDLTGHFHGERYTIAVDVEPNWVRVRKIPKAQD